MPTGPKRGDAVERWSWFYGEVNAAWQTAQQVPFAKAYEEHTRLSGQGVRKADLPLKKIEDAQRENIPALRTAWEALRSERRRKRAVEILQTIAVEADHRNRSEGEGPEAPFALGDLDQARRNASSKLRRAVALSAKLSDTLGEYLGALGKALRKADKVNGVSDKYFEDTDDVDAWGISEVYDVLEHLRILASIPSRLALRRREVQRPGRRAAPALQNGVLDLVSLFEGAGASKKVALSHAAPLMFAAGVWASPNSQGLRAKYYEAKKLLG